MNSFARTCLALPLAAAPLLIAACEGSRPERPERVVSERFQDLEETLGPGPSVVPAERGEDTPSSPGPVAAPITESASTPLSAPASGSLSGSGPESVTRPTPVVASDAAPAVARLELTLPARTRFVLHGTFPVPPGALTFEPGRTPLAIVRHGTRGAAVPAQVEVVSRGPGGEPDVVEVLAVVAGAGIGAAGARAQFDVIAGDYELDAGPAVTDEVGQVMEGSSAGRFLLRSHDVFGNTYTVDLGGAPEAPGFGSTLDLARGPATWSRRTYGTQVATHKTGDGPTLPHLFGVHAYWTARAEDDRLSLDLRVNNGAAAGSREHDALESPLGIVYFDGLELVVPSAYRMEALFEDVALGEPYDEGDTRVFPLVRPPGGNKLHMMPPQGWLMRRVVLAPETEGSGQAPPARPNLEGLAFCVRGPGLWSWWNPATAHFFPQRSVIARWGSRASGSGVLRGRLTQERNHLARLLKSGSGDGNQVPSPAMGWAHPWFMSVQGTSGGVGIQIYEGHLTAAAASREGYERLMILHRMNACRQPSALWNRDGAPVGYHLWLTTEGHIPFDFRTNGRMAPPRYKLPMFGGRAASKQVLAVHAQARRPAYDKGTSHLADGKLVYDDTNLLHWMPHDGQHMIRYTKNPKALVWLGNDALAKDDLIHAAELFHLQFHESPHRRENWSEGVTLRYFETIVEKKPHSGLSIGRDHAWGIDAMCAAYSVADVAWRERNREWFTRVARLFLNGAMPSGVLQRRKRNDMVNGKYEAAQTYQTLFLLHAQRCMIESVLRGTDDELRAELEELYLRTTNFLYFGPAWARLPMRPGSKEMFGGPRWAFAVGLSDGMATPPFSDAEHWGKDYFPPDGLQDRVESNYQYGTLDYAMQISPPDAGEGLANRYLMRTLKCRSGYPSYDRLLARLFADARKPSNDNSGNWAGLVGRIQALGK